MKEEEEQEQEEELGTASVGGRRGCDEQTRGQYAHEMLLNSGLMLNPKVVEIWAVLALEPFLFNNWNSLR